MYLHANDLISIAKAFAEGARKHKKPVELLQLNDHALHNKGQHCFVGTKGKGCEIFCPLFQDDDGAGQDPGATAALLHMPIYGIRSI